jgi:hypothetical protein
MSGLGEREAGKPGNEKPLQGKGFDVARLRTLDNTLKT